MPYEPVLVDAALLDTHTLIWMVTDEERLGQRARDVLFDSGIRKFISPAAYWEMAIKIKLGKLEIGVEYDELFGTIMQDYGLEILHVHPRHTSVLTSLHLYHGDPFDRLMIAQASIEAIPIISIDSQFDPYPVTRWWDYDVENVDEEIDDSLTLDNSEEANGDDRGE